LDKGFVMFLLRPFLSAVFLGSGLLLAAAAQVQAQTAAPLPAPLPSKTLRPATTSSATASKPSSTSQTTSPATKLSKQYTALAGSGDNAKALVTGLRDGKSITLNTSTTGFNTGAPPATFTPATGKMGYGNVNIALSLAKADLAKQGITNPTPAQLAAALNGGMVTGSKGTLSMAGVLAQRQSGMGWGAIAKSMGVKLGSVVSASKTDKAGKTGNSVKTAKAAASHKAGKSGDPSNSHKALESAHGTGSHNAGGNSHGGGGGGGGGKK
jgi:hypothetical protein